MTFDLGSSDEKFEFGGCDEIERMRNGKYLGACVVCVCVCVLCVCCVCGVCMCTRMCGVYVVCTCNCAQV